MRSAPRLLLVLTELPPAVGGMQTHARHLAAHFARHAAAIEVLTYRIADPQLARAARDFDERCGYPVRRVLSRLGYWHNVSAIAQRVREFRADAVYASTVFYGLLRAQCDVPVVCRSVGNDVLRPWLGYPYRLASGWLASPPVHRALRPWLEHGRYPDWVDRLFRDARERVMRRAAAGHSTILANSHYTGELLRGIGVEDRRIEVVSGGVDAKAFTPLAEARRDARAALAWPEDSPVILTVCRLVAKKGVEVLLEAFAQLLRDHPRARLVVVGDGSRRRLYESRAFELGLGASVRFAGRVPHEEIPRWFWAADLFVLASYESRHAGGAVRDVETMGRVLCEANAAGVALVATNGGGTPSVVTDGDNGLLVPPRDAGALAQAMARVLRDPALANGLVRRGMARAQREFDWSAVMARNESALERALAARV